MLAALADFEHDYKSINLLWAVNFSFWLILLFYDFAKTSC